MSAREIITEKVNWVIEREVLEDPYIAWVSVEQIIWGKGMHWKDADCPEFISTGLIEHFKFRPASKLEQKRWRRNHNWSIPFLPPDLYRCIKAVVREKIINPIIRGESNSNIQPFWCQGYIDPETTALNPAYTYDICGWWFILKNQDAYEIAQDWLNMLRGKNKALKYQFEFCKSAYPKMIRTQIAQATSKLELLEEMEKYNSHLKINPTLEKKYITWDEELE